MNNYTKHMARGPQRRGAQCSRISCIGLRPALIVSIRRNDYLQCCEIFSNEPHLVLILVLH